MTTLLEFITALQHHPPSAQDQRILAEAYLRAGWLLRSHAILFGDVVRGEIGIMQQAGFRDREEAAYYCGLQVGWRSARGE